VPLDASFVVTVGFLAAWVGTLSAPGLLRTWDGSPIPTGFKKRRHYESVQSWFAGGGVVGRGGVARCHNKESRALSRSARSHALTANGLLEDRAVLRLAPENCSGRPWPRRLLSKPSIGHHEGVVRSSRRVPLDAAGKLGRQLAVVSRLPIPGKAPAVGPADGPEGRSKEVLLPLSRRRSVQDVAALARVSTGTVSNVLNRPDLVNPATAERVRRAIEDLGYVRNASAGQLRSGESRTVGAVVLDLSNPFFSEVVKGIEDRLADDGLVLLLCSSHNSEEKELRQLRVLEEQRVFGLIIMPLSRDMAEIEALHRRGTRVVLLDREAPRGHFCSVAVDDVRGGELAVAHLLSQGHDRVGFVNGTHAMRQYAERYRGALRAVRSAGLDPQKALIEVIIPALTTEGGEHGVLMLAEQEGGLPPSIFCVNDQVALGVLRALRARGLSVPDDVSVVGYDDVEFAAMLSTPLTSVRQPMYELGHTATSLLLREALDSDHRHKRVRFIPELVVRASSQRRRPER